MLKKDSEISAKLVKRFRGLWCRARQLSAPSDLTVDVLMSWSKSVGLDVQTIEERKVGAFRPISALVLTTIDGTVAAFPTVSACDDPAWLHSRQAHENIAAIWSRVEWFEPLWVPRGKIGPLVVSVKNRSKEEARKLFDYHTSTIYTLAFQAVCIEQFISKARTLATFYPIVREAYLAFYAGFRAASIAALIPVMEGALSRISKGNDNLHVHDKIDRIIDKACLLAAEMHFECDWIPDEYVTTEYLYGQDERVFIFETFRHWLKASFFCKTDEYEGVTWLNRHTFAHGASTDWTDDGNFRRLIVAIATLGVIESWHDESNLVPLLLPDMDQNSILLWQQAQLQAQGQLALRQIEQLNYQQYGQIVPPRPTDDGALLRSAYLTEQCVIDLVRPLRGAGWSVEMCEPDKEAIYMEVIARNGAAEIHVGLLFSSATDSAVYRQLAERCIAILYLGAPFHKADFARGIDVHVGPVSGWQPPRPPLET